MVGMPELPKLNVDNPVVQDYLLGVARHWIDFGIDGWRLDVPEEIGTPGFWERFRTVVKGASNDAYIVGELWGTGRGWLDGDRCDGITNYELGRLSLGFFARDSLPAEGISISGYAVPGLEAAAFAGRVEKMLKTHAWEYALASLNYLDSHDMPPSTIWSERYRRGAADAGLPNDHARAPDHLLRHRSRHYRRRRPGVPQGVSLAPARNVGFTTSCRMSNGWRNCAANMRFCVADTVSSCTPGTLCSHSSGRGTGGSRSLYSMPAAVIPAFN